MRQLCLLLFVFFSAMSQANSLERLGHANLILVGESRLKVLFWDVYDASLYVSDGAYHPDKPFALSLRYLRDFSGSDIAERSIEEIRQQGLSDTAILNSWMEQFKAIFPNVVKGDEIIGIHDPSEGASFFLNGALIGNIADTSLSRRFFDIWLSEKTSEPEMRESLIGLNRK